RVSASFGLFRFPFPAARQRAKPSPPRPRRHASSQFCVLRERPRRAPERLFYAVFLGARQPFARHPVADVAAVAKHAPILELPESSPTVRTGEDGGDVGRIGPRRRIAGGFPPLRTRLLPAARRAVGPPDHAP